MKSTQYPDILEKDGIEYVTVTKLRQIVNEECGYQPPVRLIHQLAGTGEIDKTFHYNFIYLRLYGKKSVTSYFKLNRASTINMWVYIASHGEKILWEKFIVKFEMVSFPAAMTFDDFKYRVGRFVKFDGRKYNEFMTAYGYPLNESYPPPLVQHMAMNIGEFVQSQQKYKSSNTRINYYGLTLEELTGLATFLKWVDENGYGFLVEGEMNA